MMAFFSENRTEFVLTQIACMSDSITIVPIPTRSAEYSSVSQILHLTELRTLCVTRLTLPLIINMHNEGLIQDLRCLISFDSDLDISLMD